MGAEGFDKNAEYVDCKLLLYQHFTGELTIIVKNLQRPCHKMMKSVTSKTGLPRFESGLKQFLVV